MRRCNYCLAYESKDLLVAPATEHPEIDVCDDCVNAYLEDTELWPNGQ